MTKVVCLKCNAEFIDVVFEKCPECGGDEIDQVVDEEDGMSSFLDVSDKDLEVMNTEAYPLSIRTLEFVHKEVEKYDVSSNAKIVMMLTVWTSLIGRGIAFFKSDDETFSDAMSYAMAVIQSTVNGSVPPDKNKRILH